MKFLAAFFSLFKSRSIDYEARHREERTRYVASLLRSLPDEVAREELASLPDEFRLAIEAAYRGSSGLASPRELAGFLGVRYTRGLKSNPEHFDKLRDQLLSLSRFSQSEFRDKIENSLREHERVSIGEALEAVKVAGVVERKAALLLSSLPADRIDSVLDHFNEHTAQAIEDRLGKAGSTQRTRHATLCEFLELDRWTHDYESASFVLLGLAEADPAGLAHEIEVFYTQTRIR